MKTITQAKANTLMRAVDKLYDAGIIDQYTYEKAMTVIRELES